MKPSLDMEETARAIRAAVASGDWDALALLDAQLLAWLAEGPHITDLDGLKKVCGAYRAALLGCRERADWLQVQIAVLDNQREAQMTYEQVSQWEHV